MDDDGRADRHCIPPADPTPGASDRRVNIASTDGAAALDTAVELRSLRARVARLEAERREADHRIANNLQIAANLLRMQQRVVPEATARHALAAAEARLRGIARLHHDIRDREDGTRVSMRALLGGLASDLRAAIGLACVVGCEDFSVPGEVATQVAVIVGELGLNAVKHAYDGRDRARIVIECRLRDGGFVLLVSDHGPGLPEGFDISRSDGLGMAVIDAAVRRLGGTLRAHVDGGAHFTLVAPLS